MPQKIDYADKTDRDILIELVVQGNSSVKQGEQIVNHLAKLNGSVASNARRLDSLEGWIPPTQCNAPPWMTSKKKVAGYSTLAVSVATVIAVLIAEFIKCMG